MVVEANQVSKVFGSGAATVQALREVSLAVAPGEFVAVMGPSGSGKSTLLHVLGGLETPTSGNVTLAGRRLGDLDDKELTLLRRRQVGFVFQFFNLHPLLTAEENVALPLAIEGVRGGDARERVAAAMQKADIAHRATHFPAELSGGEQQRVAIARALATEPAVVMADEPTGNLDSAAGDRVKALLRGLARNGGPAVLLVTHDPAAAALADRLLVMRDGCLTGEHRLSDAASVWDVLRHLEESR